MIEESAEKDMGTFKCEVKLVTGETFTIYHILYKPIPPRIVTELNTHHHFEAGMPISLPCNVEVSNYNQLIN